MNNIEKIINNPLIGNKIAPPPSAIVGNLDTPITKIKVVNITERGPTMNNNIMIETFIVFTEIRIIPDRNASTSNPERTHAKLFPRRISPSETGATRRDLIVFHLISFMKVVIPTRVVTITGMIKNSKKRTNSLSGSV
jgi:hypothetical protein